MKKIAYYRTFHDPYHDVWVCLYDYSQQNSNQSLSFVIKISGDYNNPK